MEKKEKTLYEIIHDISLVNVCYGIKLMRIYLECKKDLKKSIIRNIVEKEYRMGLYPELEAFRLRLERLHISTASNNNNLWAFITINPKPDITLIYFKKQVFKYLKRNIVKSYLMVFEQRGDTLKNIGQGFHAHILIERNTSCKTRADKFFQFSSNTFKKVCAINIKACFYAYYISLSQMKEKREYLMGHKHTDKLEKVKIDKIWREAEQLQPYYHKPTEEVLN